MDEKALLREHGETPSRAGVYQIHNTVNHDTPRSEPADGGVVQARYELRATRSRFC
jgi:hypothetical protein